jgi:hydrogenase expression/formation protein HypE
VLGISIDESVIPVEQDVQGACEMLGFDPLYLANEGRFVVFLPGSEVEKALVTLRAHPVSSGAVQIGTVGDNAAAMVTLTGRIGTSRVLDMLTGEQLPRIC